jgi:hypothetical protein
MRPPSIQELYDYGSETLRIGTFNVKIGGNTRADDPVVIETVAGIVAGNDITTLTEVTNWGFVSAVLSVLNDKWNLDYRSKFVAIDGDKEDGATIYNNRTVEYKDTILNEDFAADRQKKIYKDKFLRVPPTTYFQAKTPEGFEPRHLGEWSGGLTACHLSYSRPGPELITLNDLLIPEVKAYALEQQLVAHPENVIPIGDFNVSWVYLPFGMQTLQAIPKHGVDTTQHSDEIDLDTQPFDRIILDAQYNDVRSGGVDTFLYYTSLFNAARRNRTPLGKIAGVLQEELNRNFEAGIYHPATIYQSLKKVAGKHGYPLSASMRLFDHLPVSVEVYKFLNYTSAELQEFPLLFNITQGINKDIFRQAFGRGFDQNPDAYPWLRDYLQHEHRNVFHRS